MDLVLVFLAKKRPRARDNERKSYNNITPAHYGNVAETQNPWGNERPRPEPQAYTPYRHRKELYLKTVHKKCRRGLTFFLLVLSPQAKLRFLCGLAAKCKAGLAASERSRFRHTGEHTLAPEVTASFALAKTVKTLYFACAIRIGPERKFRYLSAALRARNGRVQVEHGPLGLLAEIIHRSLYKIF